MSPIRMSKVEAGIRVVLAFRQAFNRQDVPAMLELMSAACVCETPGPPPDGLRLSGRQAAAQYWQDFFEQHPGARLEVEDIFGFGKRCSMRWRCTWVAENGEQSHIRGIDLFEVQDGLISEKLSYVKG